MDAIYQQLIDRESSRIESLRQRIARHEQRIAVIREMAEDDEREVKGAPNASRAGDAERIDQQTSYGEPDPIVGTKRVRVPRFPTRISAASLQLLAYLGADGKTLDELVTFASEAGLGMDRGSIRSFANIYKTKFGLVESHAPASYRLTEAGQLYLVEHYKEDNQAPDQGSTLAADASELAVPLTPTH